MTHGGDGVALASGPAGLLERDLELAAIVERVEAACAGQGSLIVIEGPAGIGKSRLVEAARASAEVRGVQVLAARGSELECDFPFAVVRQLFEPALAGFTSETRQSMLSGAAETAGPLLDGRDPGVRLPRGDAIFSVLHGLYWLCVNLAAEGPLALVVDDVHWADPTSLRWLRFAASRLEGLPVLVILAARPGERDTDSELMDSLRRDAGAVDLKPLELSAQAVAQLVRSRLAPDAEDEFCEACHEATHGNPFLLSELLATLSVDGGQVGNGAAKQVRHIATDGVAGSVLARLARLPEAAGALTRALAVLGGEAETALAARLAGVDYRAANAAVGDLLRCQILAAGRSLSFVHPLVRASVYADLSPAERGRIHARAARLLADDGAAVDVVALHMLQAEPAGDPWAVEWLRRAASRAMASGASEAAITYLTRALAEPPDRHDRPAVLLELGVAEAASYAPEAEERLNAALELATAPGEQALVALELGRMLVHREHPGRAIEAFDRGVAAALAAGDRELALRLEADAITAATESFDRDHPATPRAQRLMDQVREGATSAERLVLAAAAWEQAVSASAPADAVVELAQRALAAGELLILESAHDPTLHVAVAALALCDRLAEAEKHFTDALEEANRAHSLSAFAMASYFRGWVSYRRGALASAEEDARAALDVASSYDWAAPISLSTLLECLIARGRVDEAREALDRWGSESSLPDSTTVGPLLCARGRMRAVTGSPKEALEDFRRCGRVYEAAGIRNPGLGSWRSASAHVLAALGDRRSAEDLVAEELEIARAFGAPRNLGLALRAAGTIASGRAAIDLLEEAVEVLEGSEAQLELAKALCSLGEKARVEAGDEQAREPLRSALDIAHRCGATTLAGKAHRALLAAGGRPRRPALSGLDALTPSELRIAELAATGLTNREIAERQFLTLRMVELHLTRCYRKLGIPTRRELPQMLAGRAERV